MGRSLQSYQRVSVLLIHYNTIERFAVVKDFRITERASVCNLTYIFLQYCDTAPLHPYHK
jgi:hypothetical protein